MKDMRQDEATLTVKQAAKLLGKSPRTVQRYSTRGLRPARRGPRRKSFYRESEVQQFKERRLKREPDEGGQVHMAPEQQARILALIQEGADAAEIVAREQIDPEALTALLERIRTANAEIAKMRGGFTVSAAGIKELSNWLSGPACVDQASLIEAIRQTVTGLSRRAQLVARQTPTDPEAE